MLLREIIILASKYLIQPRCRSSKLKDYFVLNLEVKKEPISYKEAMQHLGWGDAIAKEMPSLKKNETSQVQEKTNYSQMDFWRKKRGFWKSTQAHS